MLKINNISKYFDQVKAVNNVSINVENSSMIGIIGRSGAGKSTLLRTITVSYTHLTLPTIYSV